MNASSFWEFCGLFKHSSSPLSSSAHESVSASLAALHETCVLFKVVCLYITFPEIHTHTHTTHLESHLRQEHEPHLRSRFSPRLFVSPQKQTVRFHAYANEENSWVPLHLPCLKLESKGRVPSRSRPFVIGCRLRSITWCSRSFRQ